MFVDLFSIYTVGKMEEYVIVMKMPVLEREREREREREQEHVVKLLNVKSV